MVVGCHAAQHISVWSYRTLAGAEDCMSELLTNTRGVAIPSQAVNYAGQTGDLSDGKRHPSLSLVGYL